MNLLWYIKYLGNMIIWCKFIWVDVCFVCYNWFINKRFFGRFIFNLVFGIFGFVGLDDFLMEV